MTAPMPVSYMTNEMLWSFWNYTGRKYKDDLKYAVLAEMSKRLNYKCVMPKSVVIPEFLHWKMQGGQNDRY